MEQEKCITRLSDVEWTPVYTKFIWVCTYKNQPVININGRNYKIKTFRFNIDGEPDGRYFNSERI